LPRGNARQPRVAARQGFNGNARQRAVCERGLKRYCFQSTLFATTFATVAILRENRENSKIYLGWTDYAIKCERWQHPAIGRGQLCVWRIICCHYIRQQQYLEEVIFLVWSVWLCVFVSRITAKVISQFH